MDRLTKPKEFLEKLRLCDSDYQDYGMINHIADLLERYHTEQLRLGGVVKSVCDCGQPISSKYSPCCSMKCWSDKFE